MTAMSCRHVAGSSCNGGMTSFLAGMTTASAGVIVPGAIAWLSLPILLAVGLCSVDRALDTWVGSSVWLSASLFLRLAAFWLTAADDPGFGDPVGSGSGARAGSRCEGAAGACPESSDVVRLEDLAAVCLLDAVPGPPPFRLEGSELVDPISCSQGSTCRMGTHESGRTQVKCCNLTWTCKTISSSEKYICTNHPLKRALSFLPMIPSKKMLLLLLQASPTTQIPISSSYLFHVE